MTGNGKHTTYKNCDLGMVYGIVLPTFYTLFFLSAKCYRFYSQEFSMFPVF